MAGYNGFDAYRHGNKKAVTLAPVGILKSKRQRRESVIGMIFDMMSDWRNTPFENEASIRTGLRQALCLAGDRWPVADTEAADLTAIAFKKMGYARPSWDEGQSDYAVSEDYCRRCCSPLDEEQQARRATFCGPICAKAAIVERGYKNGWHNDELGRRAYNVICRSRTTPRTCKQCAKTFRVLHNTDKHQFCSHSCYAESMRTFSNLTCEGCGNSFRPDKEGRKFCSRACYTATPVPKRHVKQCLHCSCSFIGKFRTARYCSKKCVFSARYRRDRAVILQFPTISPAVFDREFQIAA